jgi:hypothetical protein
MPLNAALGSTSFGGKALLPFPIMGPARFAATALTDERLPPCLGGGPQQNCAAGYQKLGDDARLQATTGIRPSYVAEHVWQLRQWHQP